VNLKKSDELALSVETILQQLFARIRAVADDADLHHIGATSIPGALTKGDVDVLLHVSRDRFATTVRSLKAEFAIKQPENWTSDFASFGDDATYELPIGIQVTVKDSANDVFLFLRDYLVEHPDVLNAYNRLKQDSYDKEPQLYWQAKDEFFSRILAQRTRR